MPTLIKNFACDNNQLTSLPTLPSQLTTLYCSYNQLTTLPVLPPQLTTLYCNNNKLTNLPVLPAQLFRIECSNNKLTSLPALPNSLGILYCGTNQLTSLPNLASLNGLFCDHNKIAILPNLPNTLTNLNCSYNNLNSPTSFGTFSTNLTQFLCDSNNMNVFPNMLSCTSLERIQCNYNKLTILPKLPESVAYLYCHHNSITTLTNLPLKISQLGINNNKLIYLPESFGNNLVDLACHNNPDLACLTKLPASLVNLTFGGTKIQCIPNFPPNLKYKDQYKKCNATNNINQCEVYPEITGKVFFDNNLDSVHNGAEFFAENIKINGSRNTLAFTNSSGSYYFVSDTIGTFTITPQVAGMFKTIPISKTFTFSKYDTAVTQNFPMQPAHNKDSLQISLTNWFVRMRPLSNLLYSIAYQNAGSTNLTNATITMDYDSSKLTYSDTPTAGIVNTGNSLIINLGNLPFGYHARIAANFTVKINAMFGSSICVKATIASGAVKAKDSICGIVRGSYDPNDKIATPELSTQQVADGKDIDYIIRFQNTGNDTAIHVVIADTLDSKLKTSSLQMLATNHNCKTTVKDNVVFFEMRDIMLPDSNVNKVGSNGFIRFKIKPQNNLTAGTVIPNKAAIYFDYNAPVITNTAITTIKNIVTPVKVISYELRMMNEGQISNNWSTANETNIAYYNIMRSSNGSSFSSIGQVRANNKNSNEYSFIDNLQGLQKPQSEGRALYYRLMIVAKDGSISFSDIKSIQLNAAASIAIINNPVKNVLKLQCSNNAIGSTAIIVNNAGVVVKQFVITSVITAVSIGDLAKGIYYVSANGETKKFVVE